MLAQPGTRRAADARDRQTVVRGVPFTADAEDPPRSQETALIHGHRFSIQAVGGLHVCYANDPLLVAAASSRLRYPGLVTQSNRELRTFIDSTLPSRSSRSVALTFRAVAGEPGVEILKAAARNRSDLIVLGTHGLTGTNHLLLGSTTLDVLQRTTVPVLAVPRAAAGDTLTVPPSWPGDRILTTVDLDKTSRSEVRAAARLAEWLGASLLLLHVIAEPTMPAWMRGDLDSQQRMLLASAQRQLDALAASVRSRVHVDGRVVCGRAGDEIAAVAAAEHIELVTTVLRDKRGWFGTRRGSVSYHALSHAVSSVLACPPEWARGL